MFSERNQWRGGSFALLIHYADREEFSLDVGPNCFLDQQVQPGPQKLH